MFSCWLSWGQLRRIVTKLAFAGYSGQARGLKFNLLILALFLAQHILDSEIVGLRTIPARNLLGQTRLQQYNLTACRASSMLLADGQSTQHGSKAALRR